MSGRSVGAVLRLVAVLAGVLVVGGSSARAARLLQVVVEKDGRPVLEGMTSDDARMEPEVVWGYLAKVQLKAVGEVPPDPADPLRATLTGKVRVAVLHTGRPAGVRGAATTDVVVDELRLVRTAPGTDTWQLAPGEVERTAAAAGIDPAPAAPDWWALGLIGGGAVALLTAAAGVVAWRRSRRG